MTAPFRYELDVSRLRGRLAGGERRARWLGNTWTHIGSRELLVQLDDRRTPSGDLCCYACGVVLENDAAWQLDHVDPIALGGPHVLGNLEPLCCRCNWRKGAQNWSKLLPLLGGARPHKAFRDRTVEEMWRRDHNLARLFADRPRRVAQVGWGSAHRERSIVSGLVEESGGSWRAVSLNDLEGKGHGVGGPAPRGGALLTNYWTRLMGLPYESSVDKKWIGDEERFAPSAWFVPTWVGTGSGPTRSEAFRLRFRVSIDAAEAFAAGDALSPVDGQQQFPDQDEIPGPQRP